MALILETFLKQTNTKIFLLLLLTLMAAPACKKGPSLIGNVAPDFQLDLIEGGQIGVSELRGKPLILYFFASW